MNDYNIYMKDYPASQTVYSTEMFARYKGNYIHPTAIIGPNVQMGTGNFFGPYCIIGEKAEHRDYWDKPVGRVIIGNNNKFTGMVSVDAGTAHDTVIGDNCFIMKRTHIGHDAYLADNVVVTVGSVVGGHVHVMKGANLGMNVCTHQLVVIGAYSMLGMGTIVTKGSYIEPFSIYAGVPARRIGDNKIGMDRAGLSESDIMKILNEYNNLLKP